MNRRPCGLESAATAPLHHLKYDAALRQQNRLRNNQRR